MFRWTITLIVGLLLVFLTACGKSNPHSQPTTSAQQTHRYEQLVMKDANRGWAVVNEGDAMTVLRTEDGGSSWRPSNLKMLSVQQDLQFSFLNGNLAWAAERITSNEGGKIIVHHTMDGGGTWTQTEFPIRLGESGQGLMQLVFADEKNGWILARYEGGLTSSSLTLYRTKDGGMSWSVEASPDYLQTSGIAGEISFSDIDHGWLSTSAPLKPILYRTEDEGATWEEVSLELPEGITEADMTFAGQRVQFVNEQQGFYPMLIFDHENQKTYFIVYITKDGGRTWSPQRLFDEAGDQIASASFDFTQKYAYILKDRQQITQSGLELNDFRPITSVNDFKSVGHEFGLMDFTDDLHGWITIGDGSEASLYRTEDSGSNWNAVKAKITSQ